MLRQIRERSATWVVRLLLILLAASFAVWGIGDMFRSQSESGPVAMVGDIEITARDVDSVLRQEIARLQPLFGGRLDTRQAAEIGLVNAVVDRLVTGALIDIEAHRLGVTVSDEVLARQIRTQPGFMNQFREFDPALFRQALFNAGLTEAQYTASLRRDMARNQVIESVTGGARAPDALVGRIDRYRNEQRLAEVIRVPAPSPSAIADPDAEATAAFYEAQGARFMAPETRALTVVRLDADSLAKETRVPESEIRAAYDDEFNRYHLPERRTLRQIVVADEADAKRARALIDEGKDFAAVAKEIAGLEESALNMGTLTEANMLEELRAPVFALAKGAVGGPFSSPLGWHIVEVRDIEAARTRPYDEVRDEIAARIAQERAIDGLFKLSNALEDALAGGANLDEAARQIGVRALSIPAVDATGRTPDGTPAADGKLSAQMIGIAFATEPGMLSPLTETDQGGFFVLRVDSVTAPARKPLDAVRDAVVAAMKDEARAKQAEARARAIAEKLATADPAKVAEAEGLTVTLTAPFTRAGVGEDVDLPAEMSIELFNRKVGETVVSANGIDYVVARLAEIRAPAPAQGESAVAKDLRAGIANDLLT
ncbi:MAG: SurA N-terminal domain-containing protein, partial [Alphaproteobacteria bacterium]|nr:SurA N-terminal domain-containing protein [Alphaproteobacteria bacterium]